MSTDDTKAREARMLGEGSGTQTWCDWQRWVDANAPALNAPDSVTPNCGAMRFHSYSAWRAAHKSQQARVEALEGEVERLRGERCRHGWRGSPPKDGARIKDKCPACGLAALFIGTGGHLTCGNLSCKNPSGWLGSTPTPDPLAEAKERVVEAAMAQQMIGHSPAAGPAPTQEYLRACQTTDEACAKYRALQAPPDPWGAVRILAGEMLKDAECRRVDFRNVGKLRDLLDRALAEKGERR